MRGVSSTPTNGPRPHPARPSPSARPIIDGSSLPIQRGRSLAPRAADVDFPGLLLAALLCAEVAAVVLGDRALVATGQADRATEIAAQLAGSLYPGCVAPKLIEPEVPPALREIRIEYRRPQRAPDLRAPPAASPHAPSRATG